MASQKKHGRTKKRTTAVEQRLLEAYGLDTVEEAIECAATHLLAEYDIPIDLTRLAHKLGAHIVVLPPGTTLGETHRLQEHHEIRIRAEDQSQQRQRFTLAHEYAHILLDQLGKCRPGKSLEQLCDQIAAALLMPRPDVLDRIRNHTAEEVLRLSREFNVSLHAAAVRFAQLTGCAIFRVSHAEQPGRPQVALPFSRQQLAAVKISWLAGPLRRSADVRRFLSERQQNREKKIPLLTARGAWHAETARTYRGDLLVLFKPQR